MHAFLKTGKLGAPAAEVKKPSTSQIKDNKKNLTPWVEKYRPKNVDDIVEQTEVVNVIRQAMEHGDFPNMLFYGPPGTGKTSIIHAAARQMFGSLYKDRILELNASDDRGIQVVREKIKSFALRRANPNGPDGKKCPPFKIIILDEADSMTGAAQTALRRIMEKESHSTRFCLVCNYLSRIIKPITSRCTKFRFKPLSDEKSIARLEYICNEENLKADKSVLEKIVEASGGDLRQAVMCLQSITRLKGKDYEITADDALDVIGLIPDEQINLLWDACKKGNYINVQKSLENLLLEGYPGAKVIEQLNERIIFSDELTDKQKAIIGNVLGECDYRLTEGSDEYIQLLNVFSTTLMACK
ncbi:Replication factor C subunit 4 [Atta colombica]|uniref:Replication factor C subunit 4 n=2 Tax=Atta colombica TaxID=520822 RepID=A0A151HZ46_9HYME|nr:PREDICTED: replication factor C subunit 4 isoform X1 [Atta colombica]KYM77414.1 Replication factor C subunit 4 [Atta colombica]